MERKPATGYFLFALAVAAIIALTYFSRGMISGRPAASGDPNFNQPWVLIVVGTRYLSGAAVETVAMQEFGNKLACSQAQGFVQASAKTTITTCMEKKL